MILKQGILAIARVCHEANRAYCATLGDDSQSAWEYASEWQKESAFNGVLHKILNPNSKPKDSHVNWMAEKEKTGWVYGEKKDEHEKTHPCMKPWSELPIEQRRKDVLFQAVCRAMLEDLK